MDDIQLPEMELPDADMSPASGIHAWSMRTMLVHREAYARAAVLADREQRNADESDALTVAHMCGYEDGRAVVKESLTPEQERRAFEAWFTDHHGYHPKINGLMPGGDYRQPFVHWQFQAWQARAALAKGGGVNADDLRNFPGLTEWLAGGNRGISSNSIVQHLTGLKTLRRFDIDIPHDPADFDRCLQLLDAVPKLRGLLPQMATASPLWEAIVTNWHEIEASHLQEVGLGWTKARSAPKTYALMRHVIDDARAKLGGVGGYEI